MATLASLGISDGSALGCNLRVVTTRPAEIEAARAAVDEVLREVDLACSRFRPDSEIQALNLSAGKPVRLSELLNLAVQVALKSARNSAGAVDPTVGTAVKLAGYDDDFRAIAAEGGAITLSAKRVPGWQAVVHDPASRTLLVPAGVELDLGATAKALAADLAAKAALQAVAGGGVLVNLGGDITVLGDAPDEGWSIQVSDDSAAAISVLEETIAIRTGGLATSSTTVRRWNRGGVELHHIIDPQTGLPASSPWRTVTVHAATCVEANTASTAVIVMGADAAAWLESVGLPARLVARDGLVLRFGGWPQSRAGEGAKR